MPRPQRLREREQSLAANVAELEPQVEAPAAELDTAPEQDENVKTGQVSEGELDYARNVARRLGWVPKEEWKRDPEKWTDAPQFLERTPQEIQSLKERVKRTAQVLEAETEAARKEAREKALAELRGHVRAGDEDAAVRAAEEVAKRSGPPPQTQAWMGRNPWFQADRLAQAVAVAAINEAAQSGASIEDQLAAGEAAARRRFPEHFEEPAPQRSEVKLAEVRTPPPAVTGGTRSGTASTVKKERGWSDIPSMERNAMAKFVTNAVRRYGKTEDFARKQLADAYWANKA